MRWVPCLLLFLIALGCKQGAGTEARDPCRDGCDEGVEERPIESLVTPYNAPTLVAEIGVCPYDPEEVPPLEQLVDDSTVPEFKRARHRGTNMYMADDTPQNHEIRAQLRAIHPKIFECLDLVACHSDEPIGSGEIEFKFELEPDGRVRGVAVTPSEGLDLAGLVPCARKSLYEFQFPAYDGGRMLVRYDMEIE